MYVSCTLEIVYLLYLPSEWSETGRDYVFTFVCLCALSPIGLNGRNAGKCVWLVREKLRIFRYGQYIIGNAVLLAFWWYNQVQDRSRSGGFGEMYKNVTLISCIMDFLHTPQHAVQRWVPMTSLSLAGLYCARTLRADVYMITLSCTWQI